MRFPLLVTALLASAATTAGAEPPRVVAPASITQPPPPPGLTLAPGVVQGTFTAELDVSKDARFGPSSVAPDLAVGITRDLTLALVHSTGGLTGFRGAAGAGICFTGDEDGCANLYTGGALELLYNVVRGDIAVAANAGLLLRPDPLRTDVKLGLKLRAGGKRVYLLGAPSVWVATDDEVVGMARHESQLWLPFSGWVKPTERLALGLGSGVKGPIDGIGSRFTVPVGALASLSLDRHVAVGSSLVFGKAFAGDDIMNPGLSARALHLWLTVTSR